MIEQPCQTCGGKRLKAESLAVLVNGRSIGDVVELPVERALEFFESVPLRSNGRPGLDPEIAGPDPQGSRRPAPVPARRRARLPDPGPRRHVALGRRDPAHPARHPDRLPAGRRALHPGRAEHRAAPARQRAPARHAAGAARSRQHRHRGGARRRHHSGRRPRDRPRAPRRTVRRRGGGRRARVEDIREHPTSLTGRYLRSELRVPVPPGRRQAARGHRLRVVGARANNLQNLTVDIPLGLFVAVTGVSGSGKSTLVTDILYQALARHFYRAKVIPGAHTRIEGLDQIDKVIDIDQSPIGRTPRSNPGDLHRPVHPDPRAVHPAARGQAARLRSRALLLQREGRPLRGVPGRRAGEDRDALPARRLRALRGVQGPALQPGDAGGPLQGPEHRRRARPHRGRRPRLLQPTSAASRRSSSC